MPALETTLADTLGFTELLQLSRTRSTAEAVDLSGGLTPQVRKLLAELPAFAALLAHRIDRGIAEAVMKTRLPPSTEVDGRNR